MHLYVIEFCGPLGFKNKKDNRFARIRAIDDRGRISGEFVVTRSCIPKETRPGDKIGFINLTRSEQCPQQIQ